MKKYNPADHLNYVHLVGEVVSFEHRVRQGKSNYALCKLRVATKFKGKTHDPDVFQLIFWDRLADALARENIQVAEGDISSANKKGSIMSVEGRLTLRHDGEAVYYSVTGNKARILRTIPGKEPFLQEVEKDIPEENR